MLLGHLSQRKGCKGFIKKFGLLDTKRLFSRKQYIYISIIIGK
jgi:hypothetical protein